MDQVESRGPVEAHCVGKQAVAHRESGVVRTEGWVDSARKDLRTRIAEVAVRLSPLAWRDR